MSSRPPVEPTPVVIEDSSLDALAKKIAALIHRQRETTEVRVTEGFIPRSDVFLVIPYDCFVALFEIPGVRREDVTVTVAGGKVTIEGSRKTPFKVYSPTHEAWEDSEEYVEGSSETSEPEHMRRLLKELRYGTFKEVFTSRLA
ncbi:hypothetical protein VNI00_017654 [Paramarasmius palmivorus]|uniref:Hsp20/alpha crystallin family protein n=1 Tax=Paramarasmius palmivorus TaxID=297713 RepID=A0AAW0B3K9_9AGAR